MAAPVVAPIALADEHSAMRSPAGSADPSRLPEAHYEGELPTVLYRVDTRPPDEVFRDGFSAWGSDLDLVRHTINTQDRSSGFVATTSDLAAANRIANDYLAQTDASGGRRYRTVWVYRIAPDADMHNVAQSLRQIVARVQGRVDARKRQLAAVACGSDAWHALQREVLTWEMYLEYAVFAQRQFEGQGEWVSTAVILGERVEAAVPVVRADGILSAGERLWQGAQRPEGFDRALMSIPPSRDLLTAIPEDEARLKELERAIRPIVQAFLRGGGAGSGRDAPEEGVGAGA